MNKKITICRAKAGDLDDILRLNLELCEKEQKEYNPDLNLKWTYGIGKKNFIDCIENSDRFAAVARISGKIVGYLCGSLCNKAYKIGQEAEIENIFVEQKLRNLGIGRGLVNNFFDWCKSKGADRIIVRASAYNYSGIDFYRQNGFQDHDVVLKNILGDNNNFMAKESKKEEFKVSGDKIVSKIKELIKEGNVRRIIIKSEKGETIMEIPLTFAVVGTLFAPILAAVGALAALVTSCTIVVERK